MCKTEAEMVSLPFFVSPILLAGEMSSVHASCLGTSEAQGYCFVSWYLGGAGVVLRVLEPRWRRGTSSCLGTSVAQGYCLVS